MTSAANLGRAVAALILCLPAAHVCAGPSASMRFTAFWPCAGNASYCARRVLAEGDIQRDSAQALAAFLAAEKDEVFAVCFNSRGGDLVGAMKLGRFLRERRLDSCVAAEYSRSVTVWKDETFVRDAVCASACVVAFAGGVTRRVASGSKIGVHQFRGAVGDAGEGPTQTAVVALSSYFEGMGVRREIVDIASLVPPEEMHWLTPAELEMLRLQNTSVVYSRWKLDALPDGTVLARVSQTIPLSLAQVSLAVAKADIPVLMVGFRPSEPNADSLTHVATALSDSRIELRVDGRRVAEYAPTPWRLAGRVLVAELPLARAATDAIRNGSRLRLIVELPRALEQFDPSAEFLLEGAGPLITAALK